MYTEDFYACCGIKILGAFDAGRSPATLKRQVGAATATGLLTMATLNQTQIDAGLERVLTAKGFRSLTSFINPNSNQRVVVYAVQNPKKEAIK